MTPGSLKRCIAHGESPEAALTNVRKAIQLWIDTASEFGDYEPQPNAHRLMFA